MADEVDVENTLVGIIASKLYPNGTSQPSATGFPCQVFRGWPTRDQFDAATKANMTLISVAARNGVESNTTRYPMTWQTSVAPAHTLTASVSNNTITIDGTVSPTSPQNVVALIGQTDAYAYAVQASDTLSSVASALATLIAQGYPGTSSTGNVITVNGTGKAIVCRIAGVGTLVKEVKRQEKSFQITIWSPPYPDTSKDADYYRFSVAKVIDPALGALIRVMMTDFVWAHIHYERTITFDAAQAEGMYRRDLYYWVEYATTLSQSANEIGVFQLTQQESATPTGTLPLPGDAPTYTTNN